MTSQDIKDYQIPRYGNINVSPYQVSTDQIVMLKEIAYQLARIAELLAARGEE